MWPAARLSATNGTPQLARFHRKNRCADRRTCRFRLERRQGCKKPRIGGGNFGERRVSHSRAGHTPLLCRSWLRSRRRAPTLRIPDVNGVVMRDLLLFGLVGALSGSRSLLGPAMVANRAVPRPLQPLIGLMAIGEMAADKDPRIPARTEPVPLAGRLVAGAMTAAAIAAPGGAMRAAVAGAIGAAWGTFGLYHL